MPATRVVNGGKDAAGVSLDALPPIRDHLVYRVIAGGAQPDFQIVEQGTKNILLEPTGPPVQTFERVWPSEAERAGLQALDSFRHILAMKFIGAVSYRFVVELRDTNGALVEVLTDVTWSSQQPDATRFEVFAVLIASN